VIIFEVIEADRKIIIAKISSWEESFIQQDDIATIFNVDAKIRNTKLVGASTGLTSEFFKENFKLNLFTIIGDGNCYFRALSLFFFGSQIHHQPIRTKIRAWIEPMWHHFTVLFQLTRLEIENNNERTFASDIDINVTCLLLNCDILVFSDTYNTWSIYTGFPISKNPNNIKSLFLFHTNGDHYELLIPIRQ